MVLIGNVTLDSALIQNDPYATEFRQPRWWIPAVPGYLGLSSSNQPGIRSYLIRLLGVVAQDLAAAGLPRTLREEREADLDKMLTLFVPYRLVMSTWKDGIRFLNGEIDYFWEQAINGPDVRDFKRLKASKRYVEVIYQDLGAWMVNMEGLLVPDIDRGGARAMNELKDLLGQILAFKQEIGDTFQLLIGAITIKDSEIQKKLAQESKLQARRSTALTALAAIYLPLSLTTGVFGMNIVEIEEGKPKYWAAVAVAVGLLVATLPFLVWVYLDKDEQGWNRARSTVSAEHPANSQRHQVEKDGGTLSKSHSQDFEPRPLDLVRRRTTMYSQMSWTVTGASQPGSTRKRAHPEHMV
jgi:hypothetical protein